MDALIGSSNTDAYLGIMLTPVLRQRNEAKHSSGPSQRLLTASLMHLILWSSYSFLSCWISLSLAQFAFICSGAVEKQQLKLTIWFSMSSIAPVTYFLDFSSN
jgi:hypothetical protein